MVGPHSLKDERGGLLRASGAVHGSQAAPRWRPDLIGPACSKRQPESNPKEEAIVEQPSAWVKARACEQITRENGSPRTEKRLAFDRPA